MRLLLALDEGSDKVGEVLRGQRRSASQVNELTLPWYSATERSVGVGCLEPSPAEMVEAPYGVPPWTVSRPEMSWLV